MMKRLVVLLVLLSLLAAPVVLVLGAMEQAPLVATQQVSTPADAARTRAIVRELRNTVDDADGERIQLSEADLNSVLKTGLRTFSFVRGHVSLEHDNIRLRVSGDLSRIPGGKWLNLEINIPSSNQDLRLSSVKLGRYHLPERLILPGIAYGLDLIIGNKLGHAAVGAVKKVRVEGKQVSLWLGLDPNQRQVLTRRIKQVARSAIGISSQEQIHDIIDRLDAEATIGRLSSSRSTVPFLRTALAVAIKPDANQSAKENVKAALFALAIVCGHTRFQQIVGDVLHETVSKAQSACNKTTLHGRSDLRQHFVISAGLHAAVDSGIAFAVGEFKELLDTNRGGSGFSFDDLAADRAGIAFAQALLEADEAHLPQLLRRLSDETAIMPSIAQLPSNLSEQEFTRQFGIIDSPAYQAKIREIDGLIAKLSFHTRR